jgi:hypothetical protein
MAEPIPELPQPSSVEKTPQVRMQSIAPPLPTSLVSMQPHAEHNESLNRPSLASEVMLKPRSRDGPEGTEGECSW